MKIKAVGLVRVMAILVMGVLVAACAPAKEENLLPVCEKLFTALQADDLDTALTFYSDEFYKGIPREQWRARLQQLTAELGPIKRFKLRNQQADTRYSGKFYILEFETEHQAGKARHILTFIQPVNKEGTFLVAHKITSKPAN